MTHHIEAGQEYETCDPRDHIRIRILSTVQPGIGAPKIRIATLTASGRELRQRTIFASALHATGTTASGQPRKTGYRLVLNADGTKPEGNTSR